jgi:hypothetical protein
MYTMAVRLAARGRTEKKSSSFSRDQPRTDRVPSGSRTIARRWTTLGSRDAAEVSIGEAASIL